MTWRTAKQYSRRADPAKSSPRLDLPSSAVRVSRGGSPTPGPRIDTGLNYSPRPSLGHRPKSINYHPPGPGIGFRPGPAPALGRPGLLPGHHGGWKNESCYARSSKGWKPDILTLGGAHNCPGEKGPQSPTRPANVGRDLLGYNSHLFRSELDIAQSLQYLGYKSPDGDAMIRSFQRHWNLVVSRLAIYPDRYRDIQFPRYPQGNLQVDGDIGPNTLNAIEVAMINQRLLRDLSWVNVVEMALTASNGYGGTRIYNAAQGM